MNKLLEFFSLIKANLNGQNTRVFIIVLLTLLLYKILGFVGILFGFLFAVGSDACGTTNFKEIFLFIKEKLFIFRQ